MSENQAADLDGDKLGEDIGDDGLPGVGDYPPDTAMGVNDPNLVADDDVATREARLVAETAPDADPAAPVGDLSAPAGDRPGLDAEEQMLADGGTLDGDRTDVPAEVAAVHEIS